MVARWSSDEFPTMGIAHDILLERADSSMDPRCLDLEITESVLIKQPDAHQDAIAHLPAAGAQISIDDFGACYSSLNYLSELPVDVPKIDGSLVRRCSQDK